MLRRVMSYPREAQMRREEGVVGVAFRVDRSGSVVSRRVTASSGNPALDREALAMIARAQPFPTPPAGSDDGIDFATSIRFDFR